MLSFSHRILCVLDRTIPVSTVSRDETLVGLLLDLDREIALERFRSRGYSPTDDRASPLPRFEEELNRYARGERVEWTTPIEFEAGTPFERKIWREIDRIPFGASVTYAELADKVGSPGGARAAGGACGKNPLPLRVPCHRVLAAGGIGGFTGEMVTKRALLRHEGVTPFADGPLFADE